MRQGKPEYEDCTEKDNLSEGKMEFLREDDGAVSLCDSSSNLINDDSDVYDELSDTIEKFNTMSFMYTNCRSLAPKIDSLIEMFDEIGLDFAILSETWLTSSKKIERNIQKLEDREDLVLIKKNRRTRGGGVGIVFNKNKISLKPIRIRGNSFELVGAIGRTVSDSRKILVLSAYYPPQMLKDQVDALNECILSTIDTQKTAHDYLQVVLCGDMNKKDVSLILADHPDIKVIETPPTRRDETIDLCLTNVDSTTINARAFPPLVGREGQKSDHGCTVCVAKQARKHMFEKIKVGSRPFSESAAAAFGADLAAFDWAPIHLLDVNDATLFMTNTLDSLYKKNFPLKSFTVKTSDAEWMTKSIRRLSKKKKRLYTRKGKTKCWKELDAKIVAEIKEAKENLLEKVKKKVLDSGNSGSFFKAVKCLRTKEAPVPWDVRKVFPGKTNLQIANECVEYFSAISREYQPIPAPPANEEQAWDIELHEISSRLRLCKKPKGIIHGDIPPQLVSRYHDLIAVPLHCIYNKVLKDCVWPAMWKEEVVKIIPKGAIPQGIQDLRNISCTPLFSKVLEHFVLKKLREGMQLSANQFGGVKGMGIDHFLCETWHELLMNLEDTEAATSLISIDFSKAFNRMDHGACLNALRRAGIEEKVVRVVQAFLHERKMCVHIKEAVSELKLAPGGSPQGSVLGSFLFCATTDTLAETNESESHENTPDFHENGLSISLEDDSSNASSLSPIAAPSGHALPDNWMELSSCSSEDDCINLGYRHPSRRLLDTTIESIRPSQSALEDGLDLPEWKKKTAINKILHRRLQCH